MTKTGNIGRVRRRIQSNKKAGISGIFVAAGHLPLPPRAKQSAYLNNLLVDWGNIDNSGMLSIVIDNLRMLP